MFTLPTPVLFVDLDGTIRKGPAELNGAFVNKPEDVEVFEGVPELLRVYKQKGWRIVAITNQGGISLGHTSDQEFSRTMFETNRQIGNLFDGWQWCPHHPEARVKGHGQRCNCVDCMELRSCMCRKPMTGMISMAIIGLHDAYPGNRQYYRNWASLFIGDMDSDKKCAEAANVPFRWAKDWRVKGLEDLEWMENLLEEKPKV